MPTRRKILNDPVYGFITFRHPLVLELIDHPYFQRLRRIAQLGLSHLVYPGALHNRFQHAIGAMHLMQNVVDELRLKDHKITEDEEVGLLLAVLLHDIGHGPFSHALEHSIADGVHHEEVSALVMQRLNEEFGGKLDLAIRIFNNQYPKKFLHQLVSSQLDMDRLDYLARDSFFSGVVEGQVGSERILKMLDVVDDHLVVEEKGIYSVEKFIVARRFMYWQVYLHKTVLSAEYMLVNALRRAKELAGRGEDLWCSPALRYFLYNQVTSAHFKQHPEALHHFTRLDDFDIAAALKVWQDHPDKVLSELSSRIVNRELFKIEVQRTPVSDVAMQEKLNEISARMNLTAEEARYFVIRERVDNIAYNSTNDIIRIRMKDGRVISASEASDHLSLERLSEKVEKWFLAYPRG
jgi:HD superfamily phosphohydrolase